MAVDPHQVLGVRSDASKEEIKRAHRALARRYHPDVNDGSECSQARFVEIQSAYEQLTKPESPNSLPRQREPDYTITMSLTGSPYVINIIVDAVCKFCEQRNVAMRAVPVASNELHLTLSGHKSIVKVAENMIQEMLLVCNTNQRPHNQPRKTRGSQQESWRKHTKASLLVKAVAIALLLMISSPLWTASLSPVLLLPMVAIMSWLVTGLSLQTTEESLMFKWGLPWKAKR